MLRTFIPAACVAVAFLGMPAIGQTLGSGPAEAPPAGFTGGQFVDSQGCVFLRAGVGNDARWVRRIGADRRPICGQTPTRTQMASARAQLETAAVAPAAAAPVTVAAAAPLPTPTVVRPPAGAPMATVATTTTTPARTASAGGPRPAVPAASYAAPRAVSGSPPPTVFPGPAATPSETIYRAPPPRTAPVAVAEVQGVTAGCPANAPVGEYFMLTDGRRALVCTTPGVHITGARPGDPPGAASRAPRTSGTQHAPGARYAPAARQAAGTHAPVTHAPVTHAPGTRAPATVVPQGYRLAWTDDRLNPQRGPRTAEGNARMAQVWTNEVPQQLQAEAPARQRVAAVSTRSRQAAAGAGRFVQVGSYGVDANARRAVAQLHAMGLPAQVVNARIGGKPVQVVRAGPFAPGEAQRALHAARAAGYRDAFLRH